MDKLLVLFLIFVILAAGCNSSHQVITQPSITQNIASMPISTAPLTQYTLFTPNTTQSSVAQTTTSSVSVIQTPVFPTLNDTQPPTIKPSMSTATQYLIALQNYLIPLVHNWQNIIDNQSSPSKMCYSANLVFMSGAYMPRFHFSLDVMEKYVDALKEAGVRRIDLNPSLGAWLKTDPQSMADRANFNSLINYIHESGLEVAIDAEFMQGDLTVTKFADYEKAVLSVYPQMAKCNPDILILVHEPSTMAYRMNLKISPSEWRQFVIETSKVVQAASPTTKIGVGFLYYEMPTFLQCLNLPLDYLTLDIYDPLHFDIYAQMVQLAQQSGKKVYVEETWDCLAPVIDPGNLTNEPDYEQAHELWFQAINMFAKAYKLTAISPFWSFNFFSYLQPGQSVFGYPYITQVQNAINHGIRTPTFEAYQRLISGE